MVWKRSFERLLKSPIADRLSLTLLDQTDRGRSLDSGHQRLIYPEVIVHLSGSEIGYL